MIQDYENENPSRLSEESPSQRTPQYTASSTDFWRPDLKPQQQPQDQSASSQVAPQPVAQPTATPNTTTATQATANTPTNTDEETHLSLAKIFGDGRWRIFFGVFLLLVATYMLIASISAISAGGADQSIVQNQTATAISNSHEGVKNGAGWVGAFLSHLIMYRWLGLGGFIIIFYVLALGLSLVKLHKFRFWSLTFKSIISAIAVSIIAGLISCIFPGHSMLGGEHGMYINSLLIDNASIYSAIGLSILMITTLVLIFLKPIQKALSVTRKVWANKREVMRKRYYASRKAAHESRTAAQEEAQTSPAATTAETTVNEVAQPVQSDPTTDSSAEHAADSQTPSTTQLPEAQAPSIAEPIENEPIDSPTPAIPLVVDSTEPEQDVIPKEIIEETTESQIPEIEVSVPEEIEKAETFDTDAFDPTAELSHYRFPSLDLLEDRVDTNGPIDEAEQEENRENIRRSLQSYGVEIASIRSTVGPTVTLYEIVPADGVRISKIKRLGDDMAMTLAAVGIRIIAPMPGKGTIGMEVPNKRPRVVSIKSILSSKAYHESTAELPLAMGVTIENKVYMADLAKMPHLLVAGATGMGKSVGLNCILASIIFKKHPAEVKFVLVDPKMVEFSLYRCLERHFLAKLPDEEKAVITDPLKVVSTLKSLCVEMDRRYELLSQAGVRGLKEYNMKFISRRLNPEKGHRYMPYIVVVIDEFADLILQAGKEVETPISRIAAKARAVGIHMILATQRPSVNVITGTIKANFPSRMAFRVTQMNDSRTIIDRPGAEQLVGRGDMLISRDGVMDRVQCAFIDTDEVERICEAISSQQGYPTAYELPDAPPEEGTVTSADASGTLDTLFEQAGRQAISMGTCSTTGIQRALAIGFPRAGKIVDQLCYHGVVGPANGSKTRDVLMDIIQFENLLLTLKQ